MFPYRADHDVLFQFDSDAVYDRVPFHNSVSFYKRRKVDRNGQLDNARLSGWHDHLQRACQNMFVALGQARISIFIALLRKVILLIPLALILPHFMGVTGVYAAEAISDATAAICCTLLFFWQFPKILEKMKDQ